MSFLSSFTIMTKVNVSKCVKANRKALLLGLKHEMALALSLNQYVVFGQFPTVQRFIVLLGEVMIIISALQGYTGHSIWKVISS